MATRITAADRVQRIVSIVPWIAARPSVPIDEVCTQFGISRADLLNDLDVVFMVGVPPYTPDELIDVLIEDDQVSVRVGRYFERPLRLKTTEALALLAAASALLGVPGADPQGPLARGMAKLRAGLGVEDSELSVNLGVTELTVLEMLRDASMRHERIRIDYYTAGRNSTGTRIIEPHTLTRETNKWYVTAWCDTAQEIRLFRVDRITAASLTGQQFEHPEDGAEVDEVNVIDNSFRQQETLRTVILEVEEHMVSHLRQIPQLRTKAASNGTQLVSFPVGGASWLARLLLKLGPQATVIEDPADSRAYTRAEVAELVGLAGRGVLSRHS